MEPDPARERAIAASRRATEINLRRHAAARRALSSDVRFLLWTGETHIETIARRCGLTPAALDRRLTKFRPDLLRRMTGRVDGVVRKRAA